MKTREEVEALKQNWLKDPCWDLQDTEGFEEYKEELNTYAIEHEKEWQAAREKREVKALREMPASDATLRDEFAKAALTGELAYSIDVSDNFWKNSDAPKLAERCYIFADAMLAARGKARA